MTAALLSTAIDRALEARELLIERLLADETDAYRLFHGVAEGVEGLTIDRYGPLVLVQTFRSALEEQDVAAIEAHLRSRLSFELELVYNHRGKRAGESFENWHRPREQALGEFTCRELGVNYLVRGRHRGLDPWLFLDLRAGRRFVRDHARDRSLLNLFAYTCSSGVCAAVHGASSVWNVDFAASHLEIGKRNAGANGVALQHGPDVGREPGVALESGVALAHGPDVGREPGVGLELGVGRELGAERMRFIIEDCYPVLWQLAGLPVKGRASSRPYVKLEAGAFDLVVLDPPAWSKGPFGAVDVERDYASLFKPALLATASGGSILATNHVASVELEGWIESLKRCADKAGRPLRAVEHIAIEADYPSLDGRPPLKIVVCEIG